MSYKMCMCIYLISNYGKLSLVDEQIKTDVVDLAALLLFEFPKCTFYGE